MLGFLRKNARSWSVAQLGAREMLLRSLSPEYADGPLKLCRSTASVVSTQETLGHVDLFVTLGLRPRKANASAKRIKLCQGVFTTRRRSRARCSKWAQLHFSSASVCGARRAIASSEPRTLNLEQQGSRATEQQTFNSELQGRGVSEVRWRRDFLQISLFLAVFVSWALFYYGIMATVYVAFRSVLCRKPFLSLQISAL